MKPCWESPPSPTPPIPEPALRKPGTWQLLPGNAQDPTHGSATYSPAVSAAFLRVTHELLHSALFIKSAFINSVWFGLWFCWRNTATKNTILISSIKIYSTVYKILSVHRIARCVEGLTANPDTRGDPWDPQGRKNLHLQAVLWLTQHTVECVRPISKQAKVGAKDMAQWLRGLSVFVFRQQHWLAVGVLIGYVLSCSH